MQRACGDVLPSTGASHGRDLSGLAPRMISRATRLHPGVQRWHSPRKEPMFHPSKRMRMARVTLALLAGLTSAAGAQSQPTGNPKGTAAPPETSAPKAGAAPRPAAAGYQRCRRWKVGGQRSADAGSDAKRPAAWQRHRGRIAVEASGRGDRRCRHAFGRGLGSVAAGRAVTLKQASGQWPG